MNTSLLTPIEDRAMLAYLSVGGWSARKLDRKASKDVVADNNATADAARVNKNLLASADQQLNAIRKKGDDARKYLDANTLPWDDAGNRMLPNANALEVIATLNAMEKEYRDAVDEFVQNYPALRAQAIANLGDLANDDDYPRPDQVRHKFYFRISLTPMPSQFNDARIGLTEAQCTALQAHYTARTSERHSKALQAAWTRLRENVEHIADRLTPDAQNPEKVKIFRDSLVENALQTCDLLRALNVFDDPDLELARSTVERTIKSVSADSLRKSPTVAAAVKETMDDVLKRMSTWL